MFNIYKKYYVVLTNGGATQRITFFMFYQLVNIPVEGIRLLDAVCLLLGTHFAAVWSQPGVVCSEKGTFDPLTC